MRTALVQAHRIDDVKEIRDKAEALRLYARQAGEGLENQNMMAEIKLRAERRCGELLADMEKRDGGDAQRTRSQRVTESEVPPRLADMGISRMQSSRWQAIAAVPEAIFEEHVAAVKAEAAELTSAGMLGVALVLVFLAAYDRGAALLALLFFAVGGTPIIVGELIADFRAKRALMDRAVDK